MSSYSEIAKFYAGRSVFITGATGFVGKVLMEKLLYSCSDVKTIYVLLRSKRGKTPQQRIDAIFQLPLFRRLRDEKPHVWSKLNVLAGDTTLENLGLSPSALNLLLSETEIIFHCAASLKLEAQLVENVHHNLIATQRLCQLAGRMPRLKALVHLSTAFCCFDQATLLEKFYDWPLEPLDMIHATKWLNETDLNNLTPSLLRCHPNTYTFTKRLAEVLIVRHYSHLPVAIARPSIVTPTWMEPFAGWVDSLNGPIGLMVGAAKGVIRTMLVNGSYRAEAIPCDVTVNGLIAIGARVGSRQELPPPAEPPFFNLTCNDSKRLTWGEVLVEGERLGREYPFDTGLWVPGGGITLSKTLHTIRVVLFHWMPALLIDFLMLVLRKRRFMVRIQRRVSKGLEVLQFFTTNIWYFKSDRFMSLYRELNETDKRIFNMDTENGDEMAYLKDAVLGGRLYCLKEPLSSIPKARKQLWTLYVIDRGIKAYLLYYIGYVKLYSFLQSYAS